MSKGSRKREAALLRREEEARLAQEKQKKRRRNGIIGAVVAVICVAAIAVGAVFIVQRLKQNDPAYKLHHTIVAKSDHYNVTEAMMTYWIRAAAVNFSQKYSDYSSTLGLDVTQPLKEQASYFDPNQTWFDYFADNSRTTVNWVLSLAEQARADGRTLTDEEKAQVDDYMKNINPADVAEHLTEEDIRTCQELYYLALQQEKVVNDSIHCEGDEVEAYFNQHPRDYMTAGYAYYVLSFGEGATYADADEANAMVEKLLASTPEEFERIVKAEMLRQNLYKEEEVDDGYTARYVNENYSYSDSDEFSEWLFADDRAAGDTTRVDHDSYYTVYLCLSPAARDESRTIDVRHILFTSEKYGSDDAAKAKAEEILAEWKAGDATEDSFGALAKEYTEDSNGEDGGLYTGVTAGTMVQTFNDWCFDEARQYGDTDIVKTDHGYHVMYFVGSNTAWYSKAQQASLDEQYAAVCDGYAKTYHVTLFDDVINAMDM